PPFFFVVTPGHFWEIGPGGLPRLPFTETVLLFPRAGTEQATAYTLSNLSYAVRLAGDPARGRGPGWPMGTGSPVSPTSRPNCSSAAWRPAAAWATGARWGSPLSTKAWSPPPPETWDG